MAGQVGPSSQGANVFFAKYGGPSCGSLLSVGGIIIFRVIRRHLLAAAVDPTETLHVYFQWKSFLDHADLAAFHCMHASMDMVRPHCQPLMYSTLPMEVGR